MSNTNGTFQPSIKGPILFFGKFFFHFPIGLELPFLFFLLLFIFVSLLLLWFLNRGMIHRVTRSPNELHFLFLFFLFTHGFRFETVLLDDGEKVLPNPAGGQAQPADAPPVLPDPAGDQAQPADAPPALPAPPVEVPAILNPPQVPSSLDPGRRPEDRVQDGAEAAAMGAAKGCCSSFVECLCTMWCDSF